LPEPLKDLLFADEFIARLATGLAVQLADFDPGHFVALVFDADWSNRELMDRVRHVAACLRRTLPEHYPTTVDILRAVAPDFPGFPAVIFSEFVGAYGLDHWDVSMPALAFFTPLASSEFGVRPYLLVDPQRALAYMYEWAKDENEHVRRLASEGSRPRLPWGPSLPAFKEDPTPLLPILEALKDDESEYVRRSVANSLNDISKTHPQLMLDIAERWLGHSEERDRLVKHACRTLLKAGNTRAMLLMGFGDPTDITVQDLHAEPDCLNIGDNASFSFVLQVGCSGTSKIRLEYVVYYAKAKGQLSPKVFQIREASFEPGEHQISRLHSFLERSTRRHYPGTHELAVKVNGQEKARVSIELLALAE
jgi:3-methyladenine DNA glycosylase AlkC